MHQASSHIARLPVQLLAKVLQQVGPQEALQSCALVCHVWRTAAVLSVHSISIDDCDQAKAASLANWLQAGDAAVQDITVEEGSWDGDTPELQLPAPRLQQLGSIKLRGLKVTSAAAGDDGDLAPWVVSELTTLTHLELLRCQVQLQALPALTGLQALVFATKSSTSAVDCLNKDELAEAVPVLQHLTSLHLGGAVCQDAVLAHISRLTRLQDLELRECCCTANSFQQLPPSLTRVVVEMKHSYGAQQQQQQQQLQRVSPISTPGLGQLRALQELTVRCIEEFDIGVISVLTALTRLVITSTDVVAAADGPRLVVLTALTNLQHLVLPRQSSERPAAVTPEDFAAITASQQLTSLGLWKGPFDAAQLQMVFPAQRQLPHLQQLKFDEEWLQELAGLDRVVSCCPNLESIDLMCTGGHDIADIDTEVWVAGLDALTGLGRLTELKMLTIDMEFTLPVWKAIAALTGLRRLGLDAVDPACMRGILELTACKHLEELSINILALDVTPHSDSFDIYIRNMAPEGSPDVWCQLPATILEAAVEHQAVFLSNPAALRGLLAAAAVGCRQLVEAQSELQQRTASLEQQVASLQAGMAAVLKHLQLPKPPGQ